MEAQLHRATKAAFSPRRSTRILFKQKLVAPVKRQEPESLAHKIFTSSMNIAQKALKTGYIQGIKNGKLDPTDYGGYTVQDAVYLHHGSRVMKALSEKAKEQDLPDLEAFASEHAKSWSEYGQSMFQQWNLAGASAVSLTVAAQNYLDYQNRVLKSFPPYYMIMSLLPCDMLWEWLGKELHPYAGPNNLYSFWITENDTGSQTWEDFVDAHASRFDYVVAEKIFQQGMTHELNFFRSACGEELAEIPK